MRVKRASGRILNIVSFYSFILVPTDLNPYNYGVVFCDKRDMAFQILNYFLPFLWSDVFQVPEARSWSILGISTEV